MSDLMEDNLESSDIIESGEAKETSQEAQPHGGSLKREKYPKYTGFDGRFRRLDEIKDRLPAFREFYISKRFDGAGKLSALKIVDMFNASQPDDMPKDFFPQPAMYSRWRKRWDAEQAGIIKSAETRLMERSERRIVNPEGAAYEQLEEGVMTLGAELANDAMQTLRETQEREEYFEDEVVVKRKMYALNVFAYITKAAHSKQALKIKMQGEARETAGFMLDILRRATAGKLSQEEMAVLRGSAQREHGDPVATSAT